MRFTILKFLAISAFSSATSLLAETEKQHIFLVCPHEMGASAMSIYFEVDSTDPAKIVTFGLEKLVGVNSKDLGPDDAAAKAFAAQSDNKTKREVVASIAPQDFGKAELADKPELSIRVALIPQDGGKYRLWLRLGYGLRKPFYIGGKKQDTDDILIQFNLKSKKWEAVIGKLKDCSKEQVVLEKLPGVFFVKDDLGITRVTGVANEDYVVLLDRQYGS
jgi:hypothetical protein